MAKDRIIYARDTVAGERYFSPRGIEVIVKEKTKSASYGERVIVEYEHEYYGWQEVSLLPNALLWIKRPRQ